jgi:thiol-disulfide isomerase/thioredoxin
MKNLWKRYSRKKRWWTIVLDFVFILLVLAMLFPDTRKPLSAFLIRHTLFAPAENDKILFLSDDDWKMQISEEDSGVISMEKFRGKPLFLNFWATWCPPCIAEMPSIQKLYDDYKDKLFFVLISKEAPEVIEKFMEKHEYDLPFYTLRSNVPAIFESSTIPATYFVGASGRILISKTGAARWNSNKMRRLIDDLLDEK